MRKTVVLPGVALLISLFIYMFYRTSKTVINELFVGLIPVDRYTILQTSIVQFLPLNDWVIYSLPEGLWIYCITLTSSPYYISVYGRHVNGVYLPLIICISLELLQLFHVTNGRFDFMDIGLSLLFWLLARISLPGSTEKKNVLSNVNSRTLVCILSYSIVYLSHVCS